jgi:hypothetical protein
MPTTESVFGGVSLMANLRRRHETALQEMSQAGTSGLHTMGDDLLDDQPRPRIPWWLLPFFWTWFNGKALFQFVIQTAISLRWITQRWLKKRPGAFGRVGEIIFWPVFFIWILQLAHPENPFFINDGFPWPWVGPWLIALRYGSLAGIVAALEIFGLWYLFRNSGSAPDSAFPRLYWLGGAIVTMITGEFGSIWSRQARRLKEASNYLDDRIERLTRRLYLLKLSHDELEAELIDRPGTLRDAMIDLRIKLDASVQTRLPGDRLPGAEQMMNFLAHYGHIETGGIYAYIDGPYPVIALAASIGKSVEPEADDPMVRRAVETGQSIHLLDELVDYTRRSTILVVSPILDSNGNTLGILVVNRMPFMALNQDNLRNIWTLLLTYSEFLGQRNAAVDQAQQWPSAPVGLRREFASLQRLQLDFGVQSYCVVWRIRHLQAAEFMEVIRMAHDSGDMAWTWRRAGQPTVVSLMPFMGIGQVLVEITRVRDLIKPLEERLGSAHIFTREISMAAPNAFELVRDQLEMVE